MVQVLPLLVSLHMSLQVSLQVLMRVLVQVFMMQLLVWMNSARVDAAADGDDAYHNLTPTVKDKHIPKGPQQV